MGMVKSLFAPLFIAVMSLASPGSAQSADDMVNVSVLPGWQMSDGRHMAALRFSREDGWKTYWRAPGDAGIPPRFDWSGSGNLARVALHWPAPKVFDSYGLRTVGYD